MGGGTTTDCVPPPSPSENEVKGVLDTMIFQRISIAALDRWQSRDDDKNNLKDDNKSVPTAPKDTPGDGHQDGELRLSDLCNNNMNEMSESSLNASGLSSAAGDSSMHGSAISSSLNASAASMMSDHSSVSKTSCSSSTKKTKKKSKKEKRLDRKKQKYSILLNSSASSNLDSSSGSNNKSAPLLTLVKDDLLGSDIDINPEEEDNLLLETDDKPELNKSAPLTTNIRELNDTMHDSHANPTEEVVEEKPVEEEEARPVKEEEEEKPFEEKENSVASSRTAPFKENQGNIQRLPPKSKSLDDSSKRERIRSFRNSVRRPVMGDNNTAATRTKMGKSSRLPRRSISLDHTNQVVTKARRRFMQGQTSEKVGNGDDCDGRAAPTGRRKSFDRTPSCKKILDGLASISADHVSAISTEATTSSSSASCAAASDMSCKAKLRMAMSDLGNSCSGMLDPTSVSPGGPREGSGSKSPPSIRSDRRQTIKRTFSNLGRRLREEHDKSMSKSPVPVRMPSRRDMTIARLPTTSVASRLAGTKLASIAAAAGVKISSDGDEADANNSVDNEMSRSVHGTCSTCGSSRRANAGESSEADDEVDDDKPQFRYSTGSRRERSSVRKPLRRSSTTCTVSTCQGTALASLIAADGGEIPKSSNSSRRERFNGRSQSGKTPRASTTTPSDTNNKQELSRSLHGTSSTCGSGRRARAAELSAPFDWTQHATTAGDKKN